ncbi:VanW family protein [uncultured Psychrobacillus sp.]|uniref:VanW family protein n=1 Tax=uncultured Psychrobacillus sp. TaxID=1551585 RepID=UPI00263297D6|nr:VanW family protein [uncultured Psychrobacillus sp.]
MVVFNKKVLLILSFILFISILITSLSPLSAIAKNKLNSTIGGYEVSTSDRDEIISFLNEKIEDWKANTLILNGNQTELNLESTWFIFDVEATVDDFLAQTDAGIAFWKDVPTIHLPLQFTMSGEVNALLESQSNIDLEQTLANIKEKVEVLSTEPIESVAIDLSQLPLERVAFTLENIVLNTTSLDEIITLLDEQVIGSGKVFSLNEQVNQMNIGASNETLNFVGSVLYSVILQTEFEVVERHSQGVIPSYLEAGIEVELSETKDFKFKNTTDHPASLKASIKDNALLIEMYAIPTETEGKYQIRERQEIKPRTIYRYSPDLAPGKEELIEEGKPGLRVAVYRTISDKVGPYENEELISQDYYPPTNRVILKSATIPESTVAQDPDLNIDLNGDGLPDMNPNNSTVSEEPTSTASQPTTEESSDELPEGSYYDKAGNIINGSK